MYVDGSSNINESKAGILLISLNEQVFKYGVRFEFSATNNMLVYKVILAGLCLAEALHAYHMQVYSDSQLVVDQCQGKYKAKEPTMQLYLQKNSLHLRNENIKNPITHISRDNN